MKTKSVRWLVVAVAVLLGGCMSQDAPVTSNAPPGPTHTMVPGVVTVDSVEALNPQPIPPATPQPIPAVTPQPIPAVTPQPIPAAQPTPDPAVPTEDVKAGVGVGIKGRSLDQFQGVVVTPAKSLFAAKERLAFEVAVPHALNLFQGENGRFPESHQEFMEKIVQANNITLPKLPPGQEYVYDLTSQQLMVRRPKN